MSVKLVLRESKKRKDGTAPIWIRIIENRKANFISTGINVAPKHWNKTKSEVRKSHPIAPALQQQLQKQLNDAVKKSFDGGGADEIKRAITGKGSGFSACVDLYIESLNTEDHFWQHRKSIVTKGKLIKCFGGVPDLTLDDLNKFDQYLISIGNSPNTRRKEFQRVQGMVNYSIKRSLIKRDSDPFLAFDLPKPEAPNRRKLSIEEIQSLEIVTLPVGTWADYGRDCFMLSFYCAGVRFGDMCTLKAEDVRNSRLTYKMMKTGKTISIQLPESAVAIVEKYRGMETHFLLPFLSETDALNPITLRKKISSVNVQANKGIRKAARRAGIDDKGLSMHVSRHSFADYARTQSDNLYAISKSLGHSKLNITESYLKSFDQDAVDDLMEKLWSGF